MAQDWFDADPTKLPVAFRGYARFETEELFERLAWEYAVLAGQHRELKKSVEAIEPSTRPRSELDEQAHALLNTARKAVREMRGGAARGRAGDQEGQEPRGRDRGRRQAGGGGSAAVMALPQRSARGPARRWASSSAGSRSRPPHSPTLLNAETPPRPSKPNAQLLQGA